MRSRGGARGKFILIIIMMTTFLFCVVPTTAHVVPEHVVISEVQIADNEFVELYNPTDSAIDMTGWHWCYYSSGKNWNNPYRDKTFPEDATIPSHGFYLIATTTGDFPTADWSLGYAQHFLRNEKGAVGIFPWDPKDKTAEEAKSVRIDAVGWGSVEYVNETQRSVVPGSGESIERKYLVYGYAPCQDTNNNSEDFEIKDTPTPKNSSFSTDPLPPPPSHVVISEVQIDGAGEWVELYNPTSEGIDLSSTPIYLCYYASDKNWNEPYRPAVTKMRLSGTIPVHGFYLVRIDGTVSDSDYDWGYSAPASTLSNTAGAVGIFPWDPKDKTAEEAKNGRIDAVGWGSVEYVNETLSAAVPGAGKSIERKSLYDGYAPCQDTNNNSEDFEIKDTPTPKNSSCSMSPAPPSVPDNPMPPPLSVPEFSLFGLICLIVILSVVLAIAIWGRKEEEL